MSLPNLSTLCFEILHQSSRSRARVGRIHTAHGVIDTPNFVAVGTNGTIKSLDNALLEDIGIQLMFCNTYHLLLQPGTALIKKAGGLHSFIRRNLPIITDSGGFQVFSLAYGSVANELKSQGKKHSANLVLKIDEEGVLFRSYRDGSSLLLTPESSIQAQKDLGADIIIPFDELPPYHMPFDSLKTSLARTHRWEKRSLEEHLKNPRGQSIYGVIHGGISFDLRQLSCRVLTELPFDGFAIGGSLGKNKEEMQQILHHTIPLLPMDKPNHLLGMGDLESIDIGVSFGVDTFDSSYPTKAARHGLLLTKEGSLKLKQEKNKSCFGPIERDCPCFTCRNYSLAYLHHLFKAKELTVFTLTTIHNLQFMMRYMANLRSLIAANQL